MKQKPREKMLIIVLIAGLLAPGLAPAPVWAANGKKQFKQGSLYEAEKKFDQAAEAYLMALAEDAGNIEYRIAYQRAATQASMMLVRRGRELMEQEQYEEAYNAFRRAYQFDKTNEWARDLTRRALEMQRKREGITPVPVTETPYGSVMPGVEQTPGRPTQTPLTNRPAGAAAEGQTPDSSSIKDVKKNIIFRNQKIEDIIRDLARQLDLNVAFDPSTRTRTQTIDAEYRNVTVAQALDAVLQSNTLFFEPISENTIIVAQDNTANRTRLQQMSVQTFYLKSSDEETLNTIQASISALFGQNRVLVVPNTQLRALTVRTTPETLKVIEGIIKALDKDKPEVLIDINIYEVSRNDLLEIGNQLLFEGFGQGQLGTLNALGATAGQIISEQRLALAIPTTVIRMLQQRGQSRLIDSLQVHALDGKEVSANVGQRIPIQTASLGSGFTQLPGDQPNQNPQDRVLNSLNFGFPQINYQDVGLNVTIKPTIYTDDDVKLEMQIETSGALAGPTSLTPVFTQRRLDSVATVKTGQAAMMAGVAQKRQRNSRTSLPIIGFLPIIGRFFSVPQQMTDTTDLIITVTPHIIRSADITEEDKLAMSGGQQVLGVSESIESFLQKREQARLRQQGTAPTTVASLPSPSPAGLMGTQQPVPQSPANGAIERTSLDGSAERMGAASALPVAGRQSLVAGERTMTSDERPETSDALAPEVMTVRVQPSATQLRVGDSLKVALIIQGNETVKQGSLMVRFDPAVLRARSAGDGTINTGFKPGVNEGQTGVSTQVDPTGAVIVSVEEPALSVFKSGQTPLVILDFEVIGAGQSALAVAAEASQFLKSDGSKVRCVSTPVAVWAKE